MLDYVYGSNALFNYVYLMCKGVKPSCPTEVVNHVLVVTYCVFNGNALIFGL